jgi:hypothetical protein
MSHTIINVTREVPLTTEYLNIPTTTGISDSGYWFYYVPAAANNAIYGASIKPYRWGEELPLINSSENLQMEGTVPLITESWEGTNKQYHGSSIVWIGLGTNDITNVEETDAFFFGHLGSLSPATDDDAFYWDRAFLPLGSNEWNYYQYHKHLPTNYPRYENGRAVWAGNSFITPEDKTFGYAINIRIRVSNVNYNTVLARVHKPSIGGAHNSHNDVTLPTVATKNYIPGGLVTGIGNRFHYFYISANGNQWDVFTRTYRDSSVSFSAETLIGTYDLADPTFNPVDTTGTQSQIPVRASCGCSFGIRVYFPVILNNAVSGFNLEIWSFLSTDGITGASLTRNVLLSGVSVRPDCVLTSVGSTLYAAATDSANGGVLLFSTTDGTTWEAGTKIVTNGNTNYVRIHGFKFNSEDFKYYLLLSGTSSGGANTYLGPGIYTFEFDEPFPGYKHIDFDAANNSFVLNNPLEAGYVKYYTSDGSISRINTAEPQAIANDIRVLEYDLNSPSFFNKREVGFGGNEFYYHGITLRDGRKMCVGRVLGNEGNLGGSDLLVSLFSDDLNSVSHWALGGDGDDYITSIYQSKLTSKVWLTGYSKSELVQKRDIEIHGWVRNLNDGPNAFEYVDIAIDSVGNIHVVGNHVENYIVVAKYDYNYNLIWQRKIDGGVSPDIGKGIAIDSANNIYVVGSTENYGAGNTDALLVKLDYTGNTVYSKVYGTSNADVASSISVIKKDNTEYLVMPVVSGSNTTFTITNTSGTIVEEKIINDLVVNRVRQNQSANNSGYFLFAGNDGGVTSVGKFGMGQINSNTNFTQWISSYDATDEVTINDIASSNTNEFVVCGNIHHNGLVAKVAASGTPGNWTVTKTWSKTMNINPEDVMHCECSFNSLAVTNYTETEKFIYVVGQSAGSGISSMGMEEALVTGWNSDGTLAWQNVLGHDMDEGFVAVTNDITGKHIIAAGSSTSHSQSRDGIFARLWNKGFGTGTYTLQDTGTMPYFYLASSYIVSNNTDTFTQLSTPTSSTTSLTTNTVTPTVEESFLSTFDFDGAYGPNGVFSLWIGYIDLNLLQQFANSDTYKNAIKSGVRINYIPEISGIYQASSVGDGSADDGNIFGYDVIEASDGMVYAIGVTSADITVTNKGTSGVYDYVLVELDPDTGDMEFYQNGGDDGRDEETYALTELSDGRIAYTGRITSNLAAENAGGYDVFLGIFDRETEVSDYYSIGTGLDDRGMNIHDLGDNKLAIVYTSFGAFSNTINSGSEDIGVIEFNYSTDTWGNVYQTGSSTSDTIEQNGKPSALLGDKRIAVVASSTGIFADDFSGFGGLDIVLGILDPVEGTWKKFQVGSGANEIVSSVDSFGDRLLISGHSEATFEEQGKAILVQFDTNYGFNGKSSSVT